LADNSPDTETKVPWEELVAWAEQDLRKRMQAGLKIGGRVSASSVVHSTLRRAVTRQEVVGSSLGRAKAFLSGIAKRVRSEKIRNQSAQRRMPASGIELKIGERGHLIPDQHQDDTDIWEAVASLPDEYQTILNAIYRQRQSLSEYAISQKINPHVASELHQRALQALRKQMGGEDS